MAATNHTLTFVNGVATGVTLPVGTYTYTSNTIPGYAGGTMESFTVTPTTTQLNLTISAAGTLLISVVDDLDDPITGGSLQLSNQTGTTLYGSAVTISEGSATFANVPFDASGVNFYVDQSASDELHDPIAEPQAVSMTTASQNETIVNQRKSVQLNINLSDASYAGITPINGDLVVNG